MKTATHFKANRRTSSGIDGWAITLYRFMGRPKYGQTECNCTPELNARNSVCHFCISESAGERPQYLGPMGWSFHSQDKDEDIIKLLHPIEKLEEMAGDSLETKTFSEDNIYAG